MPTPPDPMSHVKIPLFHHIAIDPPLSLPNPTQTNVVVGVHKGQVLKEIFNDLVGPSLLWQDPVGQEGRDLLLDCVQGLGGKVHVFLADDF